MKKKIIAIAVLLILIVSAAITLLLFKQKEEPPVIIDELVDVVIEEEPKEFKASLIMGGDAVIHSSVYTSNCIDGVYDFSYPLEEIKKLVHNYDLAYYNKETILGGKEYGLSNYPEFN